MWNGDVARMAELIEEVADAGDSIDPEDPALVDLANRLEDDEVFEAFVDQRIGEIDNASAADALTLTLRTTAALAQVATKQPRSRVINRLSSWINRLKAGLTKVKGSAGATAVTLEVSLGPVAVGVQW
jgi:hypothetical protein